MPHSKPNRRGFLKVASAGTAFSLAAVSYGRVIGANERISIGMIGCGSRGFGAHMQGVQKHAKAENVEFTAVSDPWRQRRQRAADAVKEWTGTPARQFVSYRDIMSLEDVDAVMIASCDHQHTTHLEAAAKAGKHVYCEKPLAMDFERLKRACDAVREAGVVFQAGTQVRSWPTSRGCRAAFAEGKLGSISRIEQFRNSTRPYWYGYLAEAKEADVDWKEFLMDAPEVPFRADRFTGWYGYRDYSDGPIPGLGSHFVDLIHYITGAKYPKSCVAHGGIFTWKDEHEFTCPDQAEAVWVYPEGFVASYVSNFGNGGGNRILFSGANGTLSLTPWTKPTISSAGAIGKSELAEETPVPPVEGPDHFQDWLQCMRSGKETNAPLEAGYQHAVAVIMAMKAFDSGKRQVYDHDKREIREG